MGEWIWHVEKAFNLRLSLGREGDLPSGRLEEEAVSDGPRSGDRIHLDEYNKMLDAYYTMRGWDKETGRPTRLKLKALGLEYIADELAKCGQLAGE